jgi:hypothetical protein
MLESPRIVVCDPGLARKIYEEEDEKSAKYKKVDGLTLGVSSIFSKSTHGIYDTFYTRLNNGIIHLYTNVYIIVHKFTYMCIYIYMHENIFMYVIYTQMYFYIVLFHIFTLA